MENGVLVYSCSHVVGLPLAAVGLYLFEPGYGGLEGLVGVALLLALNVGWSQVVYAPIPLVLLLVKRRRAMARGYLLGMGVAFLLTSGCWGLLWALGDRMR